MQSARKSMPIGVENFGKLIDGNYYFVDKTRFIRSFLDAKVDVTLITRPRRFGKTLTLSMLRCFFDIEHVEENRRLFDGLEIGRAGERYMGEQGTRPVIFLTLKGVQGYDWENVREKMALAMSSLYGEYLFLLNSTAMNDVDVDFFQRIWRRQGTEAEMESCLFKLMEFLSKHYGRSPVLFLDEYDAPIISAWERGYYEECIGFMRGFLGNALKTNDALDFAVITGVTRVSKESIFSGLNNLDVCGVLSNTYADAFGFTKEEAEKLMQDCGVEEKLPELKRWYDGYRFGEQEIYNPWSVINFVRNDCKCQPYWINSSGNSILKDMLERLDARRQNALERLVQGLSVDAPITENIVYSDIRGNRDALFMMLLTAGYLKAIKQWKDERNRDWARLEIPNIEVRLAYEIEIMNHIVPSQGETLLRDMLESMAMGDSDGFMENLSDILRDFASYHDMGKEPENFYHGLMLGLSVLMQGRYRVESNKESGYGRFDIAFFPLKDVSPGIILELKSVDTEEAMKKLAKEGLQQIVGKAYAAEFSKQGVKDVWKYGIAFCGKKIWMERG